MKYSAELIGNIIKNERNKRNWNQNQLGKKLGITGKQISKYEHGDPIPPIDIMLKLCEILSWGNKCSSAQNLLYHHFIQIC